MKFRITYFLFIPIILCFITSVRAQSPQVPSEILFADLTLKLNDQVRREIQADVDALYRNPTYFKVKTDRVNLYLPIVERELRKAGVPLDLKYLVIQESSLISDAVSTSNAVGFWQFKKGTAEEVFLRVDNQIDERKNIVSSTQGAALYLKKHQAQLNNWMCALVSYQMGLGGAKAYFGNEYRGKQVVQLDRNSHWYFKKFLAHKIAFEGSTTTLVSNSEYLEEFRVQGPTSLKQVAQRLGVTEDHLKEYNKWTSNGNIPADKPYTIIYVKSGEVPVRTAVLANNKSTETPKQTQPTYTPVSSPYPKVSGNKDKAMQPGQIQVNNLDGVMAPMTTSLVNFADQIGIRENKFRRLNDLDKGEKIVVGKYYYTQAKKTKAEVKQHITQPGETLWGISQMYGIKLSSLKSKNRIYDDQSLKPGMVLNLQEHRKRGEDIKIVPTNTSPPTRTASTSSQEVRYEPAPTPNRNNNTGGARNQAVIHTVIQGENLFRISQKYNVSVENLKNWNNLPDNTIKIGQKITIFKP